MASLKKRKIMKVISIGKYTCKSINSKLFGCHFKLIENRNCSIFVWTLFLCSKQLFCFKFYTFIIRELLTNLCVCLCVFILTYFIQLCLWGLRGLLNFVKSIQAYNIFSNQLVRKPCRLHQQDWSLFAELLFKALQFCFTLRKAY